MEHMPVATTWTASRQAGAAWASQYAASSAVRPSHLAQQPLLPGQVEEAGVPPVGEQHDTPRSAHRYATGAGRGGAHRCPGTPPGPAACSSTGSAAAANASCATGHDTPACRAASAGVIPRPATSAPACSRSRPVIRHRGGTCGTHSVNVLRAQPRSAHFHRRFTQHRSTRTRPGARPAAAPAPTHAPAGPRAPRNPGTPQPPDDR